MAETELTENSVATLKGQVAALERQVFSLLLVLIVVSGTVTVYLYREASMLRKDIEALSQQADPIMRTLAENKGNMSTFLGNIAEYAKTHPEFDKQVWSKYRSAFPPAPVAAPAQPAPAAK